MVEKRNKTVDLINIWADYEKSHPNADIEDFCHFYIRDKMAKETSKKLLAGNLPKDTPSALVKLIGRISKLHTTYAIIVLKECGLKSLDEFLYLNSIANMDSPKKTKVIQDNFNELSSGLLILDRLKKKNFIIEADDEEDKRSKKLQLSDQGQKLLSNCYTEMGRLNNWFFSGVSKENIDLSIYLLSDTEVKFSSRWMDDKEKSSAVLELDT